MSQMFYAYSMSHLAIQFELEDHEFELFSIMYPLWVLGLLSSLSLCFLCKTQMPQQVISSIPSCERMEGKVLENLLYGPPGGCHICNVVPGLPGSVFLVPRHCWHSLHPHLHFLSCMDTWLSLAPPGASFSEAASSTEPSMQLCVGGGSIT